MKKSASLPLLNNLERIVKMINKLIIFVLALIPFVTFGDNPSRMGTTAGNFLELGYGSEGLSLGDAAVCASSGLSAIYWNPAGLAELEGIAAQFMMYPWIGNMNSAYAAAGFSIGNMGVLGFSFYQLDYGEMDVTTLENQEGTGERFSANDYCLAVSFGRKLAEWFSFGASAKGIFSKIWHCNSKAMAFDMGVKVNTEFFSVTGKRKDGLIIAMSISNYGTKMSYQGMDLLQPIDISPDEHGNYSDVKGQFSTADWEIPLIFRVGAAFFPIVKENQRLMIELDALHPNNNTESVNIGAEYQLKNPSFGIFYLRAGYKALFMEDSEFGPAFGGGLKYHLQNNQSISVDYALRDVGIFGQTHAYTLSFQF